MAIDERARELVRIMKMDQSAGRVIALTVDRVKATYFEMVAEEERPALDTMFKLFVERASTGKNIEEFVNALASVYTRVYTPEEIEALSAFYSTPVGRGINDKTVEIQLASQDAGVRWSQRIVADLESDLERILGDK